jgi:hypothetical protein
MVRIPGQRRPDRGTIGRSRANRDYRMSTYVSQALTPDTGECRLMRSEFESDAVSVQIRQESVAAGECYRPHAERGGRGGIFSAVVDENAIFR